MFQARGLWQYKIVRFGLFGVLINAAAFGINYLLAGCWGLYKPLAYALVLAINALVGYGINRVWVFSTTRRFMGLSLVWYVAAFLGLRLADWAVFTFQVQYLEVYYLLAQAINLPIFFLAKFFSYRLILEPRAADPPAPAPPA